MANQKLLLIIDGNNYVSRGFFATGVMKTKEGIRTSGIHGFFKILLADIHVLRPTHLVVAFDRKGGSVWRKQLYPDYKANRVKTEITQEVIDLRAQYAPLRKILKSIGIRICSIRGEEADDVIGTLSVNAVKSGFHVVIASKDKDFAQLVCKDISILCPTTRKKLGPKDIKAKFGVNPNQIIDYLALIGDSADNIPGVHRCGGVTAAKLLEKYKTLDGVVENRNELTPSLLQNLNQVKGFFSMSKQLINLKLDVKLSTTSRNSALPTTLCNPERFERLCKKYELNTVRKAIISTLRRFNP